MSDIEKKYKEKKKSKLKLFIINIFKKIQNNITYKRISRRIENIYYDIIWSVRNLKYLKMILDFRPWDYVYILEIQNKLLIDLYDNYKKHSIEVEEDKNKSLKDIERTIELIKNSLEDDYAERCGYKHDMRSIKEIFIKDPKSSNYLMKDNPNHTRDEMKEIIEKANKLEIKEDKELAKLLTKAKEWWY